MPGWKGYKLESRLLREITTSDMQMIPPYRGEKELKSLLKRVKEESEKSGLKISIQKTKIMVSGPIPPWQIGGEIMETVTDFLFLGSRRWLLPWNLKMLAPWRKCYDQPRQHIKKQRHHFANKVRLVKAMIFPVVMYGCGEGNGNPLQYSCLENPMDGGVW